MAEIKIIVGSKNPVKIEAVKKSFSKYFKNIKIAAIDVESGVPAQPKSDRETILGAVNRATQCLQKDDKADFGVGIEGGIKQIRENLYAFAWVAIKSKKGKIGLGRTASFPLPPRIRKLVEAGKELGEANDIVFGIENSKQKMGAIGLLSKGKLNRKGLYEQGVISALVPFLNEELSIFQHLAKTL